MPLRRARAVARHLRRGDFYSILRAVSARLPDGLLEYRRLAILQLRDHRTLRRHHALKIREATAAEMDWLAACLARRRPGAADLRQRCERGHTCFVAEAAGQAVGVTWATFAPYQLEPLGRVFTPGAHGIFLYDAYTVPEWRLKGVHVNLWEHLMDWARERGVSTAYCAVEQDNNHSLRTHLSFGFRVLQHMSALRILGIAWHRVERAGA